MSCQRGNVKRTRAQKYKNKSAFKNDLHDSSYKTKQLNNIEIVNVCAKCKAVLEWKIKYKKYKLPKAPKKCCRCEQKTIKNAYHIMCMPCAEVLNVCPKCGKAEEIVKNTSVHDQLKVDAELQNFMKDLPERKRRTFLRYLSEQEKQGGKAAKDVEKTKEEALRKLNSLNLKADGDFDEDYFDDISEQSSISEWRRRRSLKDKPKDFR